MLIQVQDRYRATTIEREKEREITTPTLSPKGELVKREADLEDDFTEPDDQENNRPF